MQDAGMRRNGAVVRVPAPYVGGVYCWFSPLTRWFFSGFRPPQKLTSPDSSSTRIKDPHENQLIWLPV